MPSEKREVSFYERFVADLPWWRRWLWSHPARRVSWWGEYAWGWIRDAAYWDMRSDDPKEWKCRTLRTKREVEPSDAE